MNNSDEINTINLIRYINNEANEIYGKKDASFNHELYIKNCFRTLNRYFLQNLKDHYIFSTLSAWNRKKSDGVIFADPDKKYHYISANEENILKSIIESDDPNAENLLNDIHTNYAISLTKIMLKDAFGYDLIFEGKEKYSRRLTNCDNSKIISFPLEKLEFNENKTIFQEDKRNSKYFNDFIGQLNNRETEAGIFPKTCRLIWYYKKMQVEYCDANKYSDFMVHFIRPSFIDFDHNMLLSLALKKPLEEETLSLINLILFKIVGLMATEREKQIRIENLVKTSYSLGHNLKNRLLDTNSTTDNLVRDIKKTSLAEVEKQDLLRWTTNLSMKLISLSNTGLLLDLMARSMENNDSEIVFGRKEDWYSEQILELYSFLSEWYKSSFRSVSSAGKYGKITMNDLSRNLIIQPFLIIRDPNMRELKIRPANFVFEEIFFELFINALSYGLMSIENDRRYVNIDISSECNKIVVSNKTNTCIKSNDKFESIQKNEELDPSFLGHGGLLYIHNFLRQTRIGELKIILDDKNDIFKVILTLNGIKNRKS